jgi:hypothetical protein
VRENYDGRKRLHHLALLVGIIVGSSLLPYLFMPVEIKPLFTQANSPEQVCRIFDSAKWESRKRRGMTDRMIFIAMFTTFIIAIYEEESPLRKHMASAKRQRLGDQWMVKHCEHFPSSVRSFRFSAHGWLF